MTSGPETSTELQLASPESKALVIGVERAYVALRDARNDFDRLRIRDEARAAVEGWLHRLSELLTSSGPHIETPRRCGKWLSDLSNILPHLAKGTRRTL